MATTDAPGRSDVSSLLGSIDRLLRDLEHVRLSADRARETIAGPEDPVSLDSMLRGRLRAARHARAAAALIRDRHGDELAFALADLHRLVEEVRAGLAADRVLDDLREMTASEREPVRRALRAIANRARRIGLEADRMAANAVATGQRQGAHAPPSGEEREGTAVAEPVLAVAAAIRELGEHLAEPLAGSKRGRTTPSRTSGRALEAVADQLAASLEAYGLPHEGVRASHGDKADGARAQLIEALSRNFGTREQDGTRTYHRGTPSTAENSRGEDARLLRGGALVHADLVRAEADGVLAILDRLPEMLPFTPADPRTSAASRHQLRDMLDRIVASAADPLGAETERGRDRFQRLSSAVLDVLASDGIVSPTVVAQQKAAGRGQEETDIWARFADGRGALRNELPDRVGGARRSDAREALSGLGKLMCSLARRVRRQDAARGVAAGRLEELLTAADAAARTLENDLERSGTSPAEQEVLFLGDGTSGRPGTSLSQMIAWIRRLCQPFADGGHAASLHADDLSALADDLQALARNAGAMAAADGAAAPLWTGRPGARRQLAELYALLKAARLQVQALLDAST